ncbi:uncharacterized protein LOC130546564 [Triplophysa rosa]|uniref:uncharacterized protein LOC130546564 n=1 Tax=Triplophysa rosa TaxID=992332 RepID=UPI002545EA59|nr:uncharacterized protein LOC130546564 [Triplophysa rosa]
MAQLMVIMAGTVLLAYYFECTDTFGIHIQGFFCHDADLMKPYPGVEESSFIPPLILYCIVTAAPTTVIFIGEISMYVMKSTREALIAQEKTIVTGECCYLNPLIRRIIRFIDVHHEHHQDEKQSPGQACALSGDPVCCIPYWPEQGVRISQPLLRCGCWFHIRKLCSSFSGNLRSEQFQREPFYSCQAEAGGLSWTAIDHIPTRGKPPRDPQCTEPFGIHD